MSRLETWVVYLSTIAVGGTGLVYAWMRYLLTPADPFAVVNHPAQPVVQHLHVITAPLLVFAAGLIWKSHVWDRFREGRRRRRTGTLLLVGLAPMVFSGYLLQTAGAELWRNVWIVVHCATGGLWLLGFAGHYLAGLGAKARSVSRFPEG